MKYLGFFIKDILGIRGIILFIITTFSCCLVPFIYAFIVQVLCEQLRINYIKNDSSCIVYSLICYFLAVMVMNASHVVNGVFISMMLKKIYYLLYSRCFEVLYYTKIHKNTYNHLHAIKQLNTFMLLARMSFLLWIPAALDIFACLIFAVKSGMFVFLLLVIHIVLNISTIFILSFHVRHKQKKLQDYNQEYSSLMQDIVQSQDNNFIYKFKNYHKTVIDKNIQKGSDMYQNVIFEIKVSGAIISTMNTIYFILSIYLMSKGISDFSRIIIFSMMLGIQKDLWKLLRVIMTMMDDISSMDMKAFLHLNKEFKNEFTHHIEYNLRDKKNGILLQYQGTAINFLIGFNIISGKSGSGKTIMLMNIFKKHKHCIMMTQHDVIYRYSLLRNIICSLEIDNDILNETLCIFNNTRINNMLNNEYIEYLSGGERKIISFMRMYYHIRYHELKNNKYNFILLDEPFNHLDPNNVKMMINCLEKIKDKNYIVILTDHHNKINNKASKVFYV